MPRLRRIGEQLGYGYQPTNEDLARVRMAELRQRQQQAEEEHELMLVREQQERWVQAGATRAPRRPFTPQTPEEYEQYSPYDVHRGTVRRMDDAVDYDFGPSDLRIAGMPNGMHVMDDVGLLEDILMESIENRKSRVDKDRQEREAKVMDEIAWEEAQLAKMGLHKDDGTRFSGSNMTSGRITRTANERDASSGFGLRDYASMDMARERYQQMMSNVADRKNSIRRKFASPEERHREMFDRENQRSTSLQERFAMSQTLGNLSDRIAEMDERHGDGGIRRAGGHETDYRRGYEQKPDYERYYGRRPVQDHKVSYV